MAQSQVVVENSFIRGLVSEATGLNFPKDACTNTDNCVFDAKGTVTRRLGMDYEASYATNTVTRSSSFMNEYLWTSVAGDGTRSFVVCQVGTTLYFYSVPSSGSLSANRKSFTISLSSYAVSGAPSTAGKPCQFTSGFGKLFVAHPYCEPLYISYTAATDTLTATAITVEIRDLVGIEENIPFNMRPTSLSKQHKYNLFNQGWYIGYQVILDKDGNRDSQVPLEYWTARRNEAQINGYPSNADVWWTFKDSTGYYSDRMVTAQGAIPTNAPAPKGHYIFKAFNQRKGESRIRSIVQNSGFAQATVTLYEGVPFRSGDSVTIEGSTISRFNGTFSISSVFTGASSATFNIPISGSTAGGSVTDDTADMLVYAANASIAHLTSSYFRPSSIAFFAGRVFYGGVDTSQFNDKVYFSKIIEQDSDVGRCYQVNDPTAEDLSDLLPSDGGVISIPDMGNLIKMIPVGDDLILFATNGVWAISGSEGIGFRANDYSMRKVSSVPSISPFSFVVVEGAPVFWNNDGIYSMTGEGITPVTDKVLKTWFQSLPVSSKTYAKGVYNQFTKTVQWVYRSTAGANTEELFNYDRVLNLNMITGAFYPWSVYQATGYPTVNGAVATGYIGAVSATTKFLTTTNTTGSSYAMTFSEERDTAYVDWETPSVGQSYESSFSTGFKLPGEGSKQQFGNYINVFCNAVSNSSLKLRAKWDYANNASSGEWSSEQQVYVTRTYRDTLRRRVKIRGRGIACQLSFRSETGKPFSVIGWSMLETVNPGP